MSITNNLPDNNKVALITGGAKRIGRKTTITLHRHGYNVIIHCNNSAKEAEQLANELNNQRPSSAHFISADLTDVQQTKSLAEQASLIFGRVDVLVNNASSFYPTQVGEATEHQWEDLFGTNLKAPFFLIQSLKKTLIEHRGCVVNMVDIHAERPLKEYSIYCMAKAGLAMLTKSLARELAPDVRVNGVAPGAILWHENELSELDKQHVLNEIPLQKLGEPTDIADTILFLTEAKYVNGQIIAVDGGRSIHGGEKA
ncbi:MAG: pteridine reductase [Gammaproteobacteria bacterium]|nr:pteridine reductase [Gammaproteobacteria bacterium]